MTPFKQIDFKHASFMLTAKGISVLSTGTMTFAEFKRLIKWVERNRVKK